jgi:hypothetical protein
VLYHIIYRILGILLVVLTVASALAQKPIIYIKVPQCETIEFSVVDMPGDRYTWDVYRDSTVNFAIEKGDMDPVPIFEDGMYEGSTVRANGLDVGRYFVRVMVWDEKTCTNNLMMYLVDIYDDPPTAELTGDSLCIGDPAVVRIVLTGRGPWNLTYTYKSEPNGNEVSVNLNGVTEPDFTVTMPPLPVGITDIWVQQIIDECTENLIPSDKARIIIYPKPSNSRIYPVNK